MQNEIEVYKQIKHQIAHTMANYGDDPEELAYKLECLVIEWFEKGLNARDGINLNCPHCNQVSTVYHLEWHALTCWFCKRDTEFKEWIKQ